MIPRSNSRSLHLRITATFFPTRRNLCTNWGLLSEFIHLSNISTYCSQRTCSAGIYNPEAALQRISIHEIHYIVSYEILRWVFSSPPFSCICTKIPRMHCRAGSNRRMCWCNQRQCLLQQKSVSERADPTMHRRKRWHREENEGMSLKTDPIHLLIVSTGV